ncbi:right-handed parallel beta-helix repeat-containing protein, partial [Candidatus Bipolaricaulota bacterium]|nr:right-handed parallel beta-helix repeat-containing protein [Candidatus Bipolaricaulota bacterium]
MVRQLRAMLLLVSLCLLPFAAMGADIVVCADGDGDYRLIQRAIDAANYGDVILVSPGLYEESLVLISGITIRGSGPSHTIIRSNYGYRPVVQGLSVASVILEGLGLERGASMMESVVVDLLSSQIEFRDCHIAGGQEAGVRSTGASALSFVACNIEESFGYGLQVADDSEVIIRDCRISDNKSVGLYLRDATADVEDTIFQGNEEDGITLEGTASLDCDGVTLSDNGRWGLSMRGSSQASFVESTFGTHALGNIFVGDSASLLLETSYLDGGVEASIEGHGGASLRIADTRIENAFGDGLRLRENSSLYLERVVVADCAGNGLSLHTAGGCQLLQATVAYNGGHGLDFRGDSISVTHSIFALNDGKGLSISASSGASQVVQFDYNNVWGNREGDYAGINRSPSDVSEAPEFANPDIGNFSLSKLSPCIGAGAFGLMVGASGNPRWNGGTQVELNLIRMESMLGSVEAEMQWDTATSESIDGLLAWNYEWGFGRAKAVS